MTRLEHLLRTSAAKAPDRPAVVLGKAALTYRELDAGSDQLAAWLIGRGVAAGDRVGLYLDKSPEAVLGIFGILKAGAAYVPLDPSGPPDRARKIVDGAGLRAIVTSTRKLAPLRRIVADGSDLREAILLDGDPAADAAPHGINLAGRATLTGLAPPPPIDDAGLPAYILYTSGSTGTPKGVMISHRASLAFVEWAAHTFALTASDVVSAHAPFQFDLSILDLFATVLAGATICLVPPAANMFPRSLADFIETSRITTWYSVPSALIQMVRHEVLVGRDLSALRQILFAGEPFPTPMLRELMSQVPQARYYNLYGPTETNVCTCYEVVGLPDADSALPIGVPCCGDEAILVDETGQVVPAGTIGELLVRGPTLMDGYFNNAEATARTLTRAPDGHGIVYHTGDLVRLLPDGNLEFHGRRDNMVKTRGYRVELGEIETAIVQHEGVEEAAAVPVPDPVLGNRIEAFVHPVDDRLRPQEVQRFCAERLPAYMVPDRIHVLADGLPRTATGKVDRVALARRAQESSGEETAS